MKVERYEGFVQIVWFDRDGEQGESLDPPIARALARRMIDIANQIDRDNEDPDSLLGTP